MRVDVGNLEQMATGELTEGWYSLRVNSAQATDTGSGLNLECLITAGPEMTDGKDPAGEKAYYFLLFPRPDMKDGGAFAAKNLKKFFGATDFDTGLSGSFESEDLQDLEFDAFGTLEEYQGEERLKFKNPQIVGSKA